MTPVLIEMTPLASAIASEALVIRFRTTWRSWVASASIAGRSGRRSYLTTVFFDAETLTRCSISSTRLVRSSGSTTNLPLPE